MSLSGKVALVTGAAKGIGRALTEELLRSGAKVALLDINAAAGEALVEVLENKFGKDRIFFTDCNVQDEKRLKDAFQKTVSTFGGVDIICNNAGILNEMEWEQMVSINLLAMIRVSYVALDHMSKQCGGRGGVILNTASLAGLGPLPSCPVYTATKHGVIGFTRAMAIASVHSDYGVRFNALCPGFADTELLTNIPERLGKYSHLTEMTLGLADKLGVLSVSEVAEAGMELILDETKTGQALTVQPQGRKYVEFPSAASSDEPHK